MSVFFLSSLYYVLFVFVFLFIFFFFFFFFFLSRRRHTRFDCDWSSDVCSSDLDATRHTRVLSLLLHGRGAGLALRVSFRRPGGSGSRSRLALQSRRRPRAFGDRRRASLRVA